MTLVFVFFALTFAWDNQVFLETVEQNYKDGMSFHYVGKSDPDGQPAITIRNERTGEESIYWKMIRD
tara:strand:+ start:1823 stop:2023 length:201 start_codon:yes stop_codon:yes gene_type:complete